MPTACFMVHQALARDGAGAFYRDDAPDGPSVGESRWRLPVGAMWWEALTYGARPRERALWVMLPNDCGPFCLDGPATHTEPGSTRLIYGPGWIRTGEPPVITVTPSINAGPEVWHGSLIAGELRP